MVAARWNVVSMSLYPGLKLRLCVKLFKRDFLSLFKLLLLEQKVLVTGTFPVSDICNCLVSLVSLMPGFLTDEYGDSLISMPTTRAPPVSPRSEGGPSQGVSTLSPLERRSAFGFPLWIFDSMDRAESPASEQLSPQEAGDSAESSRYARAPWPNRLAVHTHLFRLP